MAKTRGQRTDRRNPGRPEPTAAESAAVSREAPATLDLEELSPEHDDLATFVQVGRDAYRNDPWSLLPPLGTVEAGVRRALFAGRQRAFVAHAAGRPAARVLARLHPELEDDDGRPVGMLGFFEALRQGSAAADRCSRAAQAVLSSGVSWLRERGAGMVVGPMDGDTWHRYRLNLGPFDERPFLLEPYNPPHYAGHWAAAGFVPYAEYHSLRLDEPRRAIDALAVGAERAHRAGYRLEPFDPRRFEAGLDRIYDLTVRIFGENLLYTEISRRDFLDLYGESRALVDPRLVWLARSPEGTDAGFVFAYPDHFEAVRAMGGRRGPLARLRFLLRRGRTDTVNLKTLGVLPEHRRSGLGAALMRQVYENALARGLRRANLCLILDGNPSGRLDGGAGRVLRRYRLYVFDPQGAEGLGASEEALP